MTIRLSGLSSGLDTEALVSALMSSYNLKKDNLVKARTKLSWKTDAWETMNSSILSFYQGSLNSAKLSATYNVKSTTISDSTVAKVTASSSAVNNTQTLKVTQLAATGYLTGGVLTANDSDGNSATVTSSTTLSSLYRTETVDDTSTDYSMTSGSFTVTVDGTTTQINLTTSMTISSVISQLKSAGLNASFDETNQRIFVSSPTSGADHDFTITADDADGVNALQTLGLYTINDSDMEEYTEWANYTDDEITALKDAAYEAEKVSYSDVADAYAEQYNTATSTMASLVETYGTYSTMQSTLASKQSELSTTYAAYATTDDEGNVTYDTDAIEEAGLTDDYEELQSDISDYTDAIEDYEEAETSQSEAAGYVTLDEDGSAVAATADDDDTTAYEAIVAEVDQTNADLKTASDQEIDDKVALAQSVVNGTYSASNGAVRVCGQDAYIELNGASFTNNTNSFTINGLTIQATAETGDDTVTITTETDVDGMYDAIKTFLTDYNTLIEAMDTAYNADSASGYEPLTSDEKDAMSDTEVEEWEQKIKDALLRKDSTLGNTAESLKTDMLGSYTINGTTYSLSSFGIATLGYFSSADNQKGCYHIDGDTDDSNTSGNDDKLRAAIASDPETVISFFSQLATTMYTDLTSRMSTSTLSSVYTIYNDKQMASEYSEYTTKISDQEDKIATWEDYYYNKFSQMESALATLNSNSSALSSLLS